MSSRRRLERNKLRGIIGNERMSEGWKSIQINQLKALRQSVTKVAQDGWEKKVKEIDRRIKWLEG